MKYTLLLSIQLLFSAKMFAQAGLLDSTFDNDGIVTTDFSFSNDEAFAVIVQPDGKIVVSGMTGTSYPDFITIRYNTDGSPDPGFGINGVVITDVGGAQDYAMSVLIQPDNKILVAGYSLYEDESHSQFSVVRYLGNGLPDSTFGTAGIVLVSFGNVHAAAVSMILQADGKIVVAGERHSIYGGTDTIAAARLTSNGGLDNSFNFNGKVICSQPSTCRSLIAAQDGGLFITGIGVNGVIIFKYNSAGLPDSSYGTNGVQLATIPFSNMGFSSIYQPDGKIILVGTGDDPNSAEYKYFLVRFNEAGFLDSTFSNNGIVKVNYGISENRNGSIFLQPDGKILLAGTTFSNTWWPQFTLYRYKSNGSLDLSFNDDGVQVTSVTVNDHCYAITLQQDNKIVLAGVAFSGAYEEYDQQVIVQRYLNDLIPTTINQYPDPRSMFSIYPNPCADIAYCEYELSNSSKVTIQLTDITGKILRTFFNEKKSAGKHQEELNLSDIPTGTYILHFEEDNKSGSLLTVKQ